MVRNLLAWISVAALCAALAAPVRAQDDLAAQSDFFREGESARAFGMGNAFVGLSDDVSAIYWNPAGLARLPGAQLLITRTTLDFFESDIQSVSAAMPYGRGAIGFSYSAANTDFPLFGQNPSNPLRFDYPMGVASENYRGLALAYSMPYGDNMFLGLGFKSLKYDLSGNSASGTGFDIGALMVLDEETTAGLNLQNIGGVSLGAMDEVPMNISFGAAKKFMDGAATLAASYDSKYLGDSAFGVGLEYRAADHFTLRLGSSDGNAAYGFSVDYQDFRLDYALNSGADEAETSKFTIVKTFDTGAPSSRPSKKELKRQEEERKKAEEERLKKEEEDKKKEEENKKKEEEKKKKEEEKKKKEEEQKKKEEEAKKKEEEKRKKEEEKKKQEEEERARKEQEAAEAAKKEVPWFEREEFYEQSREQVKLPSVSEVLGESTLKPRQEEEIVIPRPQPEARRFPVEEGGYDLSSEYNGIIP
jgi:hypothetical protein